MPKRLPWKNKVPILDVPSLFYLGSTTLRRPVVLWRTYAARYSNSGRIKVADDPHQSDGPDLKIRRRNVRLL